MLSIKGWAQSHWARQVAQYLQLHRQKNPAFSKYCISYEHFLSLLEHIGDGDNARLFVEGLQTEIIRINEFYNLQLDSFQKRKANLKKVLQELKQVKPFSGLKETRGGIKRKVVELYQDGEHLLEFIELNLHAISDLIKGFNKYVTAPMPLRFDFLDTEPWSHQEKLHNFLTTVSNFYGKTFTPTHREMALYHLRAKHRGHSYRDVFFLALLTGNTLPMLFFLIYVACFYGSIKTALHETFHLNEFWDIVPIYRGSLVMIIFIYLYGLITVVWKRYRINHTYLLSLNPKTHVLNYVTAFKLASLFLSVWTWSFCLYIATKKEIITIIDAKWFPFAFVVISGCIILLPFKISHPTSRFTFLKTLGSLLITPFGYSRFRENYAADVLSSLILPNIDVAYSVCYYSSGAWSSPMAINKCHDLLVYAAPFCSLLPFVCRILQSMRHGFKKGQKIQFLNAAKYVLALIQILLVLVYVSSNQSEWVYFCWAVVAVLSMLIFFLWDVFMDFGVLGWKNQNQFWSKSRKYPKWLYIISIILDFFARIVWVGTLSYPMIVRYNTEKRFWNVLFAIVELVRRALWIIIRLEWMQVSNFMKFRKHKYVPRIK